MKPFENLPILLNFEFTEDNLILRLDNQGLHNFENQDNVISLVILENIESNKNDLNKALIEPIGSVF